MIKRDACDSDAELDEEVQRALHMVALAYFACARAKVRVLWLSSIESSTPVLG